MDIRVKSSIEKQIESIVFKKKQRIYQCGQSANGFYYVSEGMVGLYQVTEGGKESLLRVYGPKSYFGYRSLFTSQSYPSTARTMLPSTISRLRIDNFDSLFSLSPILADLLMREVCNELGEAEKRLVQFSNFDAKKRIDHTLYYFFNMHPTYPWTYREISEYSGTDIRTVIRHCTELKKLNILDSSSRKPLIAKGYNISNLVSNN